MVVVITCDGVMLGLYTSQVDAWKVAKPIIGASTPYSPAPRTNKHATRNKGGEWGPTETKQLCVGGA